MVCTPDGDWLRVADVHRADSRWHAPSLGSRLVSVGRESVTGRAFVDGRTVYVADFEAEADADFAEGKEASRRFGHRSNVAVPLLRQGTPIGVLSLTAIEPRAFTEERIALLESFADQAVIAIENARLFQELEQRNAELQESNRQVTEALEQQTATAEVLRVIASSPTDLQPVLGRDRRQRCAAVRRERCTIFRW